MSDDSTLLIKISADTKNVTKAYDDIKKQTEDLEGALESLAKISGVAFAALTAQVGLSVKAFSDSDTASRQLSDSLQDQGIYTDELKESYKAYAEQVSANTGISTVQITQAQSVAQQYLGQIPITKQLTAAIADLAVKQGVSLTEAATEVGKAIGNGTGQLLRMGLQVSATSTATERYAQVLDFVSVKAGGAATALSPVELATKKLATAFEEGQVALGEKFAPAVTFAINALTSLVKPSKDASGEGKNFEAALIAAGLAVSGLATAAAVGVPAVIAIRAAIKALNVDLTVTSVLLKSLGIGLAIAGISFAIAELAEHWTQSWAAIKAVTKDSIDFVAKSFSGLGTIIHGLIGGDLDQIKYGLSQVGDAFKMVATDAKKGWDDAANATKEGGEKQVVAKQVLANKLAAITAAQEATNRAVVKAENQLLILDQQGANDEVIKLKQKEIAELKALANKKQGEDKSLIQAEIAQTRIDEQNAANIEIGQRKELNAAIIKSKQDLGTKISSANEVLTNDEQKSLRKNAETEETAQKKVYQDEVKLQVQAHNTFLEEQTKYGATYAAINQLIHSKEVQGIQTATSDLAQLTQSKNATLQAIGKAASIANIVIKTAESAMNIYAGFSVIPFVGPELGIAGAAAAVAFGAEQIADVTSAQTGGLVTGVGFGDTQPYMLEPGELVTPRQNFNEVVNSVANSRSQQAASGQDGSAQVQFSLKDNLMDFVEAKLVQRKALNISLQGNR